MLRKSKSPVVLVRPLDRSHLREQLASGELEVAVAPLGFEEADLHSEHLWRDHLLTLVAKTNRLAKRMTVKSFAAAGHIVDAGLVQVAPDGAGNSVVDAMLASLGLRRRVVAILPTLSSAPAIVASRRGAGRLARPSR